MDVTHVKQVISACHDVNQVSELERHCKERVKELWKRELDRLETEAWDRVKKLKTGTVLYCCAEGIFIGGDIQRGDKVEVYCIQPRRKRLWVDLFDETGKTKKKYVWLSPSSIHRYNLRVEPPAHGLSKLDRAGLKEVGAILDKVIP